MSDDRADLRPEEQAMPLQMQNPPRRAERALPMTDAERAARVALAGCYRVFDLLGWTELIFNHITLRVPGPEDAPRAGQLPGPPPEGVGELGSGPSFPERVFLINPFGLHYREVTPDNLVAVDIDGQPVRPTEHPVNRAGFVTHAAIHRAIADAHCVMHTHTTTGCAVSCLAGGLSHDSFYGAQLHGQVAYHDFEGVTVNPDEQPRMVADIGGKHAVILRNHGLLAWGRDIPEAFMWLWTLQRACDIQIAAAAAGPLRALPPEVLAQTVREAGPAERAVCEQVFGSLLRRAERR